MRAEIVQEKTALSEVRGQLQEDKAALEELHEAKAKAEQTLSYYRGLIQGTYQ